MARYHLPDEFLDALGSPETLVEFVQHLLRHVLELCPHCEQLYEEKREALVEEQLREAVGRATTRFVQQQDDLTRQLATADQKARKDLQILQAHEHPERLRRIRRALTRFRSPFLVERLISESRSAIRDNPQKASELAEAAFEVALRIGHAEHGRGWAMTCLARAKGYRGNALRVQGDFKEAEPFLASAFDLFQTEGNGDVLVEAELLLLLVSLRRAQNRFAEGEALVNEATDLLQAANQHTEVARALVLKANLLAADNRLADAVGVIEEAIEQIDPQRDRRLLLSAQHNRAFYLKELGRFGEAYELLLANADLYRSFPDPWTRLRYRWSLGTTTRGLGQLSESAEHLSVAHQGLLNAGYPYDAALAGLDLALVYVQTRETHQLRTLALESFPVFQEQDMHREALAALLLFQQAAKQDAVTASTVTELIGFLRKVRKRPVERPS